MKTTIPTNPATLDFYSENFQRERAAMRATWSMLDAEKKRARILSAARHVISAVSIFLIAAVIVAAATII